MFKRFIVLLVIILVVGGVAVALQVLGYLTQALIGLFPIFAPAFEQALTDYLSSPKFIISIIVLAFSSVGIILNAKEKKIFYIVISGIIGFISLASIISNFICCSY